MIPDAASLAVLPYPGIGPVAFEIGPFAVRWYALAYIAGLVFGWSRTRGCGAEPNRP